MTRQFSDDLTRVADETRFVDLSGRVRTASRRKTMRRSVTAGAAALILVIAGIAGLTVLGGRTADAPPANIGKFDGLFLYLTTDPDDDTVELQSWDTERSSTLLTVPGDRISGELAVSPTGEWAAWESDIDPQHRAVMVATLATGETNELFRYDSTDKQASCPAPTWAPDGEPRLLTVDPEAAFGGVQWLDASTGDSLGSVPTAKERDGQMCELRPAVREDGEYDLYYARGNAFELRYLRPDGTFVDTGAIAALGTSGAEWNGLSSVNVDGTAACLSTTSGTDGDVCAQIIDPRTGDVLRDFGSAPPADVRFLPDGELLTRDADGVLRQLDADGNLVARLTTGEQFTDATLAGYLPD